jgi:tryptophanyl-tRNA synthetase
MPHLLLVLFTLPLPASCVTLLGESEPFSMKKRVFSGARPTGRLHIGNYLGAIQNWVALQDEYDCVYCIVDIHALTSMTDTSELQQNIMEMALDWMACGIDPERSIVFVQSKVPEVTELFTYLGMLTPESWLLRVPTFKEKVKNQPENVNFGLVGYPVLQTADIILYKANAVPVGEDQLPHIELAREIVRRFNLQFGDTFPEPQAKLTQFPLILGLDGVQKMSKSLGNTIDIAMTEKETTAGVMSAVTDPQRQFRKDPGRPEICNIYKLDGFFNPGEQQSFAERCRKAEVGCVEHKQALAKMMNARLAPIREKRAALAAKPEYVKEILAHGAERAGVIARETMAEVRRNMRLV